MKAKSLNLKQKQLKQKLQAIRNTNQLKQIYKNVEQQNRTLRDDILSLRYKVDLLQEKQKAKNQYVSQEDTNKNKQLHMFQIELKQQYKLMQELKKRKQQSVGYQGSEELATQYSQFTNKVKVADNQLQATKLTVSDLRRQSQRLQKTQALYFEEDKRNQPKLNEYSSQNTTLKKRIMSLRKLQTQKEHQSSKVMNSMYSIKTKVHRNQQFQKELENQKLGKTNDKMGKSKSQSVDLQSLKKEVSQLKDEYHRQEHQYTKSESYNLKRRQQLLQENKEELGKQRELEERKARLQRELNKFKRTLEKHNQYKNNSKFLKEYLQSPIQVDQFTSEEQPLRRQFAGVLGGRFHFDDRPALGNNRRSYMTGFMAYELQSNATNKNSLVALRAIYDDAQVSANNSVPIPGHFLSKCKMTRYLMMQGDFIKLLKVKYNSNDSRILKVQIRTNKNNRYEFGDKRQFNDLTAGQNVYGFDISISEYPVSLFGSYGNARSHWYMQSLGVEINQLEE